MYAETVTQQQDKLRTVRNFLSLLSGAVNDQSWPDQDAVAASPTGQFSTQGPNGVTVEGQPITLTGPGASLSVSPAILLALAALAAYVLLK